MPYFTQCKFILEFNCLNILKHDLVLYSQKNFRFGVQNAISVTLKTGKATSDVVNEKARKYVGMFAFYE